MGRVTIAGLAEQLGISKASVSYALNGQPGVSEQTRRRVLDLAGELGWYPSSSARALSKSQAGVVGIVLSREPELIGSEPYYMRLIAGIESVLITTDISLLLRVAGAEEGRDLAVYRRWAAERRVDGVILFDHLKQDPRQALLQRLGLPFVLHGASAPYPRMASTTADQAGDAAIIVGHLQAMGHRRIAHVTGPLRLLHEDARQSAVRLHAGRAGIEVLDVECDYTVEGGARAAEGLLSSLGRPTAIIFSNDLMAMGGVIACRRHMTAVPGEVSVVSWDDSMLCWLASPSVTALHRDPVEQGRQSARLLLEAIDGGPPRTIQAVPSALNVRESSAPPPVPTHQ
ncbi:LacI family DNA-binding transcriptional regulator [Pseudarthrobacter sp. NPDC080039]|uniref:LacI family DNA-binding transcriptional regulator n=1 Tax=unclassified Pseudarthrobacter TaxID=2647000 RepID=UPI00344F806F